MIGIRLYSTNPAFNLAFEEYLCKLITPEHEGFLLLWQNRPSIIIGRFQNTFSEVNQAIVDSRHLDVVRRLSGGGAVYHDEGNLNFSFIVPSKPKNFSSSSFINHAFIGFLQPIIDMLASFGVEVNLSGRNDLLINGSKFSGSAQLRTKNAVLHHGTMLINLNMENLDALNVDPEKYRSKGLSSVRSRVTNLQEYLPQDVGLDDLAQALLKHCCTRIMQEQDFDLKRIKALAEYRYYSWDWNYGKSPEFDVITKQYFPWGMVQRCLSVKQGIIASCRIFGDFFATQEIEELEQIFIGKPYQEGQNYELKQSLFPVEFEKYFINCDNESMYEFLSA